MQTTALHIDDVQRRNPMAGPPNVVGKLPFLPPLSTGLLNSHPHGGEVITSANSPQFKQLSFLRMFCLQQPLLRALSHSASRLQSTSIALYAFRRLQFDFDGAYRWCSHLAMASFPRLPIIGSTSSMEFHLVRVNQLEVTRSHPEMVGDMSRVTLNFDL